MTTSQSFNTAKVSIVLYLPLWCLPATPLWKMLSKKTLNRWNKIYAFSWIMHRPEVEGLEGIAGSLCCKAFLFTPMWYTFSHAVTGRNKKNHHVSAILGLWHCYMNIRTYKMLADDTLSNGLTLLPFHSRSHELEWTRNDNSVKCTEWAPPSTMLSPIWQLFLRIRQTLWFGASLDKLDVKEVKAKVLNQRSSMRNMNHDRTLKFTDSKHKK